MNHNEEQANKTFSILLICVMIAGFLGFIAGSIVTILIISN